MPDRTDEIRAKHASSRPCGCCRDIFYLLDVNARLRKVADAAQAFRDAVSAWERADGPDDDVLQNSMTESEAALYAALDALEADAESAAFQARDWDEVKRLQDGEAEE